MPGAAVRLVMARRFENDLHEEAMHRICFVCTGLIKGQHFDVEKFEDLLASALKVPELFVIPGVTPYNFCKSCYYAVKRADKGESVKSTRSLQEWSECTENCPTCLLVSKRKSGGRTKKVSFSNIIDCFFEHLEFSVEYVKISDPKETTSSFVYTMDPVKWRPRTRYTFFFI